MRLFFMFISCFIMIFVSLFVLVYSSIVSLLHIFSKKRKSKFRITAIIFNMFISSISFDYFKLDDYISLLDKELKASK